jgi:hypothetical protein
MSIHAMDMSHPPGMGIAPLIVRAL